MSPADQERLVAALEFALGAHGGQTRKGKDVPYVSHLLQVAGLVLEYGGDPELAAAALLHDVLEDSPDATHADLTARFGARVAGVVEECSDLLEGDTPDRKSPWQARKSAYVDHLRGASRDAKLVAACDKLHNLGNVLADLRADGPVILERFNGGPAGMRWYYAEVRDAVAVDVPPALVAELDLQLAELRERVDA